MGTDLGTVMLLVLLDALGSWVAFVIGEAGLLQLVGAAAVALKVYLLHSLTLAVAYCMAGWLSLSCRTRRALCGATEPGGDCASCAGTRQCGGGFSVRSPGAADSGIGSGP